MILFFSPYPQDIKATKTGLFQRVLAIDSLFSNKKRIYIAVSYSKNFFKSEKVINENLKVYNLNAMIHFFFILKLILNAKFIYSHTIANALKYLPYSIFFKKKRFVCDMHGITPEEYTMIGSGFKSFLFNIIEYFVLKLVDKIICVTNSMGNHYRLKYPQTNINTIILPIFSINVDYDLNYNSHYKINKKFINIIYAGGTQVWQNFNQMLELSMKMTKQKYHFEFWIPDNSLVLYQVDKKYTEIIFKTGTNKEVISAYSDFDLGFVLRDDTAVNNVACPTKIVEYIQNGVVPILKSNKIGDFIELGMKYFLIEELITKEVKQDIIEKYKINNLKVYELFNKRINDGKEKLVKFTEINYKEKT